MLAIRIEVRAEGRMVAHRAQQRFVAVKAAKQRPVADERDDAGGHHHPVVAGIVEVVPQGVVERRDGRCRGWLCLVVRHSLSSAWTDPADRGLRRSGPTAEPQRASAPGSGAQRSGAARLRACGRARSGQSGRAEAPVAAATDGTSLRPPGWHQGEGASIFADHPDSPGRDRHPAGPRRLTARGAA